MNGRPPSRRSVLLVAGTLAAATVTIVATLMIPPLVGLADNGDFDRVLLPAGLRSLPQTPEDRYFQWMQPRFVHAARTDEVSAYRTSELLLARAAVAASRIAGGPLFDVRFLGAVHAAILLLALGVLVAAGRDLPALAQAVAAVLLVFFFTDAGYLAAFQSFYSQTASLLFLLLTAGVAALAIRRGRLSGFALPAYFLCAALFVTSKPQESIQAILLAPFGVRLAWPRSRRGTRAVAVLLAAALLGLAWRYYRSAQNSIGWITRYNVVFLQMLPNSPDPAGDLADLGLDPSLARFAGVSAWVPESPIHIPAVRAFVDGSSGQPSPRLFYLRHPARFAALLALVAKSSYALQPEGLGNFAKESSAPPKTRSIGPWGSLRVHLAGLPWLVALFCGTLGAAAATYRRASPRERLFREGLTLLVVMAAGAFLVTALGDALGGETGRHLYAFHAMCDLILIADVIWLTQAVGARLRARRAEGQLGAPPGSRLPSAHQRVILRALVRVGL